MRHAGFALGVAAALAGCASPPREWVVVLPSADGHAGTVVVTREGTETVLQGPYRSLRTGGAAPFIADEKEVATRFGDALAARPKPPERFTLYFVNDRDELTRESRAALDAVVATIGNRPAPEIVLIGHADTTRSHEYNDALSLRRAERVRAELVRIGVPAARIGVEGRGKREPIIPTPDGQAEPRNRRVEVEVR